MTTIQPEKIIEQLPDAACSADAPRYSHARWESIGELMVDLLMNITPRPFWVQFGRYATKVTDDNKDSLGHGLHMALEFQLAHEPNVSDETREPITPNATQSL